jgi:hypothetical protein
MDMADTLALKAAEARQAAGLLAAIEAMEATLRVAAALAAEGRRVDLAGLEAEMGRLCAACLVAPEAMLPALRGRLAVLLGLVDALAARLAPP